MGSAWVPHGFRTGLYPYPPLALPCLALPCAYLPFQCILTLPRDGYQTVQERVYKSNRLWNLLLDMEESIGTPDTTRAAYDRMFDLHIITPQVPSFWCVAVTAQNVLNYAAYLEEHNCYEESFRVYEKGLEAFPYPHSREIWLQYLNRFIARYGDSKIERARDIFEKVPANLLGELMA